MHISLGVCSSDDNDRIFGREIPDHGHPRANFLGAIGRYSRGEKPLLFSTEIAALFDDIDDPDSIADEDSVTTQDKIDFVQTKKLIL